MYKLLDGYCGEGGTGFGFYLAGFEVVGADHRRMKQYPFPMTLVDVLNLPIEYAQRFDAISVGPPCQDYSPMRHLTGKRYPRLIALTREWLKEVDRPYVMENVVGAWSELENPQGLCGAMFGLGTFRHRLFETNWPLKVPQHQPHNGRSGIAGRATALGHSISVIGNITDTNVAREVMQMPWATRRGLTQAIPPAYTHYIGNQLREYLDGRQD
jgi:DNA (cytosine-5)-methyltransferase 1